MADIIRLLPDHVANQIAAGEVIQRPASAVKELMENSVDAGSTVIHLIIRDAGKTLIQVVDNGAGMSDIDARLAFERHATSKIVKADDLYALRTMGFRGEALASIAAVAQVELKTRQANTELGSKIIIEGSEYKSQEPVASAAGSSLAIRNLFYNVPARRNFLKSNPVETRHILDEFFRISLANPSVNFTLHHNDLQIYDLRAGNFRQRITALFGPNYKERLVPVEEDTTIVKVEGYIGKPEFSKKNRGEQYFFVNKRFITDKYLNHAVLSGFESLIPKDAFPSYWLNITIDPAKIDVNIHPTKTEIKFEDDKSVYAIIRAAVKRALGKFNVSPPMDFDRERSFDIPLEMLNTPAKQPVVQVNPEYNPFNPEPAYAGPRTYPQRVTLEQKVATTEFYKTDWQRMREQREEPQEQVAEAREFRVQSLASEIETLPDERFVQSGKRIGVISTSSALYLVDLPLAHEKVLYTIYHEAFGDRVMASQQQLFPPQIELNAADANLVTELSDDLRRLGFDLSPFGATTFVIHGTPADLEDGFEPKILQSVLEQYRNNHDRLHLGQRENLIRSMARSMAIKPGQIISSKEIRQLVLQLLESDSPRYSVAGKAIFIKIEPEQLQRLLES